MGCFRILGTQDTVKSESIHSLLFSTDLFWVFCSTKTVDEGGDVERSFLMAQVSKACKSSRFGQEYLEKPESVAWINIIFLDYYYKLKCIFYVLCKVSTHPFAFQLPRLSCLISFFLVGLLVEARYPLLSFQWGFRRESILNPVFNKAFLDSFFHFFHLWRIILF